MWSKVYDIETSKKEAIEIADDFLLSGLMEEIRNVKVSGKEYVQSFDSQFEMYQSLSCATENMNLTIFGIEHSPMDNMNTKSQIVEVYHFACDEDVGSSNDGEENYGYLLPQSTPIL